MTPKQARFVDEYLKDLNATKAAARSGYSEKTGYSQGQRLLKNVEIQRRIQECMDQRAERNRIEADYVLERLVEIDQMDWLDIMSPEGGLKPISEWPRVWRQSVTSMVLNEIWEGRGDDRQVVGMLMKIRLPDKLRTLELLGKHTDVRAWDAPSEGGENRKSLKELMAELASDSLDDYPAL